MRTSARKILIAKLVQSRYQDNQRPADWDKRVDGIDTVQTSAGEVLHLYSTGGQTPPTLGSCLMLLQSTKESKGGIPWTLYGLRRTL